MQLIESYFSLDSGGSKKIDCCEALSSTGSFESPSATKYKYIDDPSVFYREK